MIVSTSANTINFWSVKTSGRLKEIKIDDAILARFFPDNNIIRIWDVESGKELKQLEGDSDVVNDVKYFPDGQIILSCSSDKTIRLWNVKSGNQKQKIEINDVVSCIDILSDGSQFVFRFF
ncbi:WD repeat-containing protein [Reticulomyxa filosa]|uniref:WD repeat-containing protein n=1 Tax=Reticulomyxa filosa TaxID=46433 RepID=X6MGH9_RETFI|nr:WD repeat-containing protein [Reticulomyxa filosa]|eukprot:ETO12517.1 WD repeat-containing protein [Reticulomyxa filosa]